MKPRSQNSTRPGLTLLGRSEATLPEAPSRTILETFPNRSPKRRYVVRFETEQFTSLCPITGQPDFAKITLEYTPSKRCIESKSLKFYLASYRGVRAFNEEVVNRILDDLVAACAPLAMRVEGVFAPRGGIGLTVTANHPDKTRL